MTILIIGTWGFIFWLLFSKLKLVPLNTYTGLAAVGCILVTILMKWVFVANFQPGSRDGRLYGVTTPIVAQVTGQVVEVLARENERVATGTPLLRIDPTRYEAAVAQAEARAAVTRSALQRQEQLLRQGATPAIAVDMARADADAAAAQLDAARFDLANTVIRAPSAGYATQVIVRPGQFAYNLPFNPAVALMVFVQEDEPLVVATFPQQTIKVIAPGQDAELAFDTHPGYIFKGKVRAVLPATGSGQLLVTGGLRSTTPGRDPGRVPVIIEYGDEVRALGLPIGTKVNVAIYTPTYAPVAILRMLLLRIESWQSYLFVP